ncbi:MAG: GNAT family N-acetyltransferase, partial [Kiritimatiellia bacterium]|nr:GNAT family N-acetyltransferase [Kiritimatiellia bacterium]
RGHGMGSALMRFMEQDLRREGESRPLWCNARLGAIPFYERLGWRRESDVFDIPGVGPHVRMVCPRE